jgi:hypothetical protein
MEEEEQENGTVYRLSLKKGGEDSPGRPILRLLAGDVLSFDVRAASAPDGPFEDSWSPEHGPPAGLQIRLTSRQPDSRLIAPVTLSRTVYFMANRRLLEGGAGL